MEYENQISTHELSECGDGNPECVTWSIHPRNAANFQKRKGDSQSIDRIREYLKKSDKSLDVHTFNMARRPNSLARLFKTDDSRIKKTMENAGLDREGNGHVYPEKAGKSTVMVILEE